MTTLRYRNRLRALLTPAEHRIYARLDSAHKIQDFLDRMPVNFEPNGDTAMSPRGVLETGVAHCAEAAVFACAALAYHGKKAWLLDLEARPSDHDHVVALFQERGLWGAISKTNHAILRWRDPIYRSAREVAMTYAHEYALPSGLKSLMTYSRPFPPTRYVPERWVTTEEHLDWLLFELALWPHVPVAPAHAMRKRRRSAPVEMRAQEVVEWAYPRGLKPYLAPNRIANYKPKKAAKR